MPDHSESRQTQPLRGPLARLDRTREELAKAWIVGLIERSSLEEIKDLPTERIARELPELISDVLGAAAPGPHDPFELSPAGRERAERLAELRDSPREHSAEQLTRDVSAVHSVIIRALAADAADIEPEAFGELAGRLVEAVGAVQAAAVESLVGRRSRKLESQANSDPLTGLANLRRLQDRLRDALALHKRYESPFALLVLDIDGLKRVNDSHGHAAGDRVLVQSALAIRRTIRDVDTPARIGGDEFCVLAPNQTAASARKLGERLAEAVESDTDPTEGAAVGVSVGVVSCPEHGDDSESLLATADLAMYRAKAGGERVALGDPDQPELIKVQRTKK